MIESMTRTRRPYSLVAACSHAIGLLALVGIAACGTSDSAPTTVFEDLGFIAPPSADSGVSSLLLAEIEAAERAVPCMLAQGFDYVPWTSLQLTVGSSADASPSDPADFASERGYGMLYNLPASLMTNPAAKQDPNAVYTDGLLPDERRAYLQTLLGADAAAGERLPRVDSSIFEAGGCLGREMRASSEVAAVRLAGDLYPAFEDLQARANADPRLVDYDSEWSSCMAAAGFAYASSAGARDSFLRLKFEIWATAEFPAAAYDQDELRALSPAERRSLYSQLPTFDADAWNDGLELELQVAIQDIDCQGENPRFELLASILREMEPQFLSENQSVLDRLSKQE